MRDDDDIFDPYGSSRKRRPVSEQSSDRDDVLPDDVLEWVPDKVVKKPGSSSSSWLVGLLLLVLVLLAGFGIALSLQNQQRQRLAPRVEEDAEVKFAQAAAAFNGEPADLNDPRVSELNDIIDEMRIAYLERDAQALGELFDFERMLQEILRVGDAQFSNHEFTQALQGLKDGLAQALIVQADLAEFERFEIKSVEFTVDGNEALFYVKEWANTGVVVKLRYWAIRNDDRWRIYDFEDLSISMRASDLMSMAIGHIQRDMSLLVRLESEMFKLNTAIAAIGADDIETARTQLAAMQTLGLPAPIQAVKCLMDAGVAAQDGDYESALQHLNRAQAMHSDLVAASLMRAVTLNGLGRYEEALAEAQKFLDKLGGDPDASLEAAIALQGLNRPEEALAVMRTGLDDDPTSVELFLNLARSLPPEQAVEAGERFMKLSNPGDWLPYIEDSLWYNSDVAWEIVRVYLEAHPDDVTALYYGANSLLSLNRHQEVLDLLGPIIEADGSTGPLDFLSQDEISTSNLAWLYHRAVVAVGNWNEVYQTSNDKAATFDMLAREMAYVESSDLRELVAMHAMEFPDDPRLGTHQATIAVWDADWETAIDLLRIELENSVDVYEQSSIRYRLIDAMFNADRAMEALNTLEPNEQVFPTLMWKATSTNPQRLELMDELLAVQRAEHPDDINTNYWSIRVAYQRQDYEQALILLDTHHDALLADEEYGWEVDDLKFNCLIHLQRFDEAGLMATLHAAKDYPLFSAQLAAIQGDVAGTEGWLEHCRKLGFSEWDFYTAEFLGESLRSDDFESVREKFPEPEELIDTMVDPSTVD